MVKSLARVFSIGMVFILGMFWCLNSVSAAAGINRKINFQGKVVNTSGTNVADSNYNFIFNLYTVSSAGTTIWTETWNSGTTQVAVTNGIFTVDLGTYATFPPTVDFNTDSLYLTLSFNGDSEMTPRIRMAAVPYAINAEKVSGLTVTSTTGTLTIPSGKTISFGEAFSTTAVGITLDQNLSTLSSVNFAGLSIGSTAITSTAKEINFLHNLAVGNTGALFYANGVGITQLNIGTSGYFLMSGGTTPVWVSASLGGGTTYSANNGLSMASNVIGLGGTLTQVNYTDIDIGTGSSGVMISSAATGGQFFSITANGNVGIGKTGATAKLAIIGLGTSTNATFQTHNSAGIDEVTILDNGNIGIGTTNPQNNLTVVASAVPGFDMVNISNVGFGVTTAGVSGLQISYVGGASNIEASAQRIDITPGGAANSIWNAFRIVSGTAPASVTLNGIKLDNKSAGAGLSIGLNVGTGWDFGVYSQTLGTNYFAGNVGIGKTNPAARLAIVGVGTSTNLAFQVHDSGGNDKFTILDNGSVGIGTTTPGVYALNVGASTFSTTLSATKLSVGTTAFQAAYAFNVGGSATFVDLHLTGKLGIGNSTPGLYFLNVGGTASFTDLFTTGKVGIGTSAPGLYFLNVGGTASFNNLFTSGKVGIGRSDPLYQLDVQVSAVSTYVMRIQNIGSTASGTSDKGLLVSLSIGNSRAVTASYIAFSNVVSGTGPGTVQGVIRGAGTGTTGVAYSTGGADYGEYFRKQDPQEDITYGQVVQISGENTVTKAQSGKPIGVFSDASGFVGNGPSCPGDQLDDCQQNYEKYNVLVGMMGQIHTYVSTENGPISPGDPLTTSSIPGVAAKATKAGYTIGSALESYSASGIARINIYVNPSWWAPLDQMTFTDYQVSLDSMLLSSTDGLEVLTKRVDSLEKSVSELNGQVAGLATSSAVSKTGLEDNPIIKFLVEFWNNVLFKGNVAFEKTPSFNQDTAGWAVINSDDDQVDVVFSNEYAQMPIVNVSLMVDDNKVSEVLGENYNYTVTNRTTKGFSIKLGKKAKTDLKFAWSVVLVQDAKTYQKPTPTPLSDSNPVSPTTEPTIVPTETPLLVSPTIEPTVEPTIFISPTATPGVGESGTIN